MSGIMLAFAGGSFGPEPPPTVIGQAYGGGFYAGQIGVAGVATHYLVVGPLASAQSTGVQFKTSATGGDPTSVIDGPANSAAMNDPAYPAAFFCEGLTVGGQTDWYSPAKNELEVCYYNLKPTTANNGTSSGINANAVPARASNYTLSVPAQTSASAFQSGNAQAYSGNYWSSTQSSAQYAWRQDFGNGGQYAAGFKTNTSYNVRAIRRVAV